MELLSQHLRRTNSLTTRYLCGKRRSFSFDLTLQADEITRLLLERGNIEQLATVFWKGDVLRRPKKAHGRQENGQIYTMSHSSLTVTTWALRIEDTHEQRDLYERECNLESRLQGLALERASLLLGFGTRRTYIGFLDCGRKNHFGRSDQYPNRQVA